MSSFVHEFCLLNPFMINGARLLVTVKYRDKKYLRGTYSNYVYNLVKYEFSTNQSACEVPSIL